MHEKSTNVKIKWIIKTNHFGNEIDATDKKQKQSTEKPNVNDHIFVYDTTSALLIRRLSDETERWLNHTIKIDIFTDY